MWTEQASFLVVNVQPLIQSWQLESILDLHAVTRIYHGICMSLIRTWICQGSFHRNHSWSRTGVVLEIDFHAWGTTWLLFVYGILDSDVPYLVFQNFSSTWPILLKLRSCLSVKLGHNVKTPFFLNPSEIFSVENFKVLLLM